MDIWRVDYREGQACDESLSQCGKSVAGLAQNRVLSFQCLEDGETGGRFMRTGWQGFPHNCESWTRQPIQWLCSFRSLSINLHQIYWLFPRRLVFSPQDTASRIDEDNANRIKNETDKQNDFLNGITSRAINFPLNYIKRNRKRAISRLIPSKKPVRSESPDLLSTQNVNELCLLLPFAFDSLWHY